ncbi:hypothetical protein CSV63_02865 [Sporosarcina sp. P34]|uniref:hypothetical protein n=1 Tax=Sporosarcina sp. P34 TaxID=2048247 RepID=UPI000C169B4F|nr:hypothetical protein [Sporosarcina sp. P34]PID16846.1 hypothetical protein CSV63_02865 [Sporosarcina sp. P34]
MSDMTLAGIIIGAFWTASVIFANRKGYINGHFDGWKRGHEDTKLANNEVMQNVKRKIEEQVRKKE